MTNSSKTLKLNAHLAITQRRHKEAHEVLTELHRQTQNTVCMTGINKIYTPSAEDGQTQPPESKKVQLRSWEALERVGEALASLVNSTGTRDYTNMVAKADVILDGKVLIKDAPPVFLLSLEKELRDLRTFAEKMLELDVAQDWTYDAAASVYKSATIHTHRTAKVQDAVVVVQATDKFPAQVKDVVKDVVVGNWAITQLSGGIPRAEKDGILRRISRLEEAVKAAREQANSVEVVPVEVGQSLVDYLLGPAIHANR